LEVIDARAFQPIPPLTFQAWLGSRRRRRRRIALAESSDSTFRICGDPENQHWISGVAKIVPLGWTGKTVDYNRSGGLQIGIHWIPSSKLIVFN